MGTAQDGEEDASRGGGQGLGAGPEVLWADMGEPPK